MMEGDERRKKNFSEVEKYELVEGYREFEAVLKPKLGQTVTHKDKERAWAAITSRVNAVSRVRRSVPEIKKKWNNLSSTMKEHRYQERQEMSKTGGGGPVCVMTDIDERVENAIGANSAALIGILNGANSLRGLIPVRQAASSAEVPPPHRRAPSPAAGAPPPSPPPLPQAGAPLPPVAAGAPPQPAAAARAPLPPPAAGVPTQPPTTRAPLPPTVPGASLQRAAARAPLPPAAAGASPQPAAARAPLPLAAAAGAPPQPSAARAPLPPTVPGASLQRAAGRAPLPPAAAGAPPQLAAARAPPQPSAARDPLQPAAAVASLPGKSNKRRKSEGQLYNTYLEWEIKCSQEKFKKLQAEQAKLELEKELLTLKIKKVKMDIDGEHFLRSLTEQ
ncbi:uncharacterized protein [Diadema antillarum]|uniref:uncharacterized protein n=1 Tax=Diadema antillarum TaxID=105358 RepID=UPI003A879D50